MSSLPPPCLCRTAAETRLLGKRAAASLPPGALLSLEGDLGAGKTVFVQGLAEGLGLDPRGIGSPSFVLAVEYPAGQPPLLHVDLYRLAEGAGIDDLGIEEALARGWLVAVEWGERLPGFLRRAAWRVIIRLAEGFGEGRSVTLLPPLHSSE